MVKQLFLLLFLVWAMGISAQPIVSISHDDVIRLNRTTPTNLITNGSFETGGPNTAVGNNSRAFSRPCNTVPAGWVVTSNTISYGMWTYQNDHDGVHWNQPAAICDNTIQTLTDDVIIDPPADGFNQLYLGNYEVASGMVAQSYNAATGEYIPRANVATTVAGLSGTQNGVNVVATPLAIAQTLSGLTPGNYYELEYSVTGEGNYPAGINTNFAFDGIFELQVGGKNFLLICPGTNNQHGLGPRERYHIKFQANAASVTIKFICFGHFVSGNNPLMKGAGNWFLNNSNSRETSEVVLDDVIVNQQTITVSGKIWLDNNSDGSSASEPNYTTGNHYINLAGPDGKILYSALINATGNYSIPAPMNTSGLSLQISTSSAALEGNPNSPSAPASYSNTTSTSIALATVTTNIANQDFGIKSTTLPLKLLGFWGRINNDKVVLEWMTTHEESLKAYEVERSYDGNSFKKIADVAPGNIFSLEQKYEFTDASQISGSNFYRIRMVDLDGKFTYSSVLKISNGKIQNNEITSLVNPFHDKIVFLYKSTGTQLIQIRLADANGRLQKIVKQSVQAGVNSIFIDGLQHLAAGIYFMEIISSGNKIQRAKIIKR